LVRALWGFPLRGFSLFGGYKFGCFGHTSLATKKMTPNGHEVNLCG